MASDDLAQAARHCQKCSQSSGNLQAVWKLMGDIHLQFHAATPPQLVWAQHSCRDQKNIHSLSESMAMLISHVAIPSCPDPSFCDGIRQNFRKHGLCSFFVHVLSMQMSQGGESPDNRETLEGCKVASASKGALQNMLNRWAPFQNFPNCA